ncbi:MAG TPA: agmatine deiminase family protein [Bryobacteraceae bacterium]|nr:agmatine deiminase family protein [Bryobacteraceae bacterium]
MARLMSCRMPAEWEPHEATWIAWPHERSDWPGKFAPVPWVYGEMVRYLSRAEKVRILVTDEKLERSAKRVLKQCGAQLSNVEFFLLGTDRSWTRDYCPIFVHDEKGRVALTHWRFNGWGKYENHGRDSSIPLCLRQSLKLPYRKPMIGRRHVVLEGGSIDCNGRGTLMTTEECLLSDVQARNPGMTREQLEAVFREFLGITHVLWLKNGIAGDDTHGHVDDLARFVNPTTVVIAAETGRDDANWAALSENRELLRTMRDQDGRKLTVVELPMPRPVIFDGQRLPASYANFYIANGLVLAPVFNDPADRIALNTLSEVFPGRDVIPIYCGDLVLGLGALHCATQQQPQPQANL